MRFLQLLIRPLDLCTQAFQLDILFTFVLLSILVILVNSWNGFVFYFYILSNKLDLFKATCSIKIASTSAHILKHKTSKLFFTKILLDFHFLWFYPNSVNHNNATVKSAKCIGTISPGNTKGGSITVLLTSCLTGLESAVWQLTIFVFICKTD